jgi:hypothetical protein
MSESLVAVIAAKLNQQSDTDHADANVSRATAARIPRGDDTRQTLGRSGVLVSKKRRKGQTATVG